MFFVLFFFILETNKIWSDFIQPILLGNQFYQVFRVVTSIDLHTTIADFACIINSIYHFHDNITGFTSFDLWWNGNKTEPDTNFSKLKHYIMK